MTLLCPRRKPTWPLWAVNPAVLLIVWACVYVVDTGSALGSDAPSIPLPGPIPASIEEIAVIDIEGHPPQVEFRSSPPVRPLPRVEPRDHVVDLLSHARPISAEGDCSAARATTARGQAVRVTKTGVQACRVVILVAGTNAVLDGLSYDRLRIRGSATLPLGVSVAIRPSGVPLDPVPVSDGQGPFEASIRLVFFARHADLRDLAGLVLDLADATTGNVDIEEARLERGIAKEALPEPRVGFWVWDYRAMIADPEPMLALCRQERCLRLLVQMPELYESDDVWERYGRLLRRIRSESIEAFALDGYPDAVNDPERLAATIRRLLETMGDHPVDGIQLDIEPYLLPGFAGDADGYPRYLKAIEGLKTAVRGQTRLSIVLPFWFSTVRAGERPVAFAVIDLADEVAVMSYRTDVQEVAAIGRDILRYGDLAGVPVWLAIETRALPVERHSRFQRVYRREQATAYVDRSARQLVLRPLPGGEESESFRLIERFEVRPDRVTFHGRSRRHVHGAITTLHRLVRSHSYAGVLIHDVTGYGLLAPE